MFFRHRKPIVQSQLSQASYGITRPITGGNATWGAPIMPHLPPPNLYRGSGQYAGAWNLFQSPSINLLALPASPNAGFDVAGQIELDGLYSSQPGVQLESPPQQNVIVLEG